MYPFGLGGCPPHVFPDLISKGWRRYLVTSSDCIQFYIFSYSSFVVPFHVRLLHFRLRSLLFYVKRSFQLHVKGGRIAIRTSLAYDFSIPRKGRWKQANTSSLWCLFDWEASGHFLTEHKVCWIIKKNQVKNRSIKKFFLIWLKITGRTKLAFYDSTCT